MTVTIQDFLSKCRSVDFGQVAVTPAEQAFYKRMNDEIIDLCRSLPNSVRVAAINLLMKYSGIAVGDKLDFFSRYPVPSWSILYWISTANQHCHEENLDLVESASAIHAMAMLLHSLDDHLNDGELTASHLWLLLRSQAWYRMITAIETCCEPFREGTILAREYIDSYYGSICSGRSPGSLQKYCANFRRQMSTAVISPDLMMRRFDSSRRFIEDMLEAYCRFGIAWRLLDDIQDINQDIKKQHRSAVYYCLPANIRPYWNKPGDKGTNDNDGHTEIVCSSIIEKNIIPELIRRIIHELETAATLANRQSLSELAAEFALLQTPLLEIELDRF